MAQIAHIAHTSHMFTECFVEKCLNYTANICRYLFLQIAVTCKINVCCTGLNPKYLKFVLAFRRIFRIAPFCCLNFFVFFFCKICLRVEFLTDTLKL